VRQAQAQVSGQDCAHVGKVAPMLRLSKMCLCVQSFHFTDPELRQSGQGCTYVRQHVPVLHLLNMFLCDQKFPLP